MENDIGKGDKAYLDNKKEKHNVKADFLGLCSKCKLPNSLLEYFTGICCFHSGELSVDTI